MRCPRPRGMATILLVVLLLLLLIPLSLMLLVRSTELNRGMARQKGIQSSRKATHSLITDFMSQFSKGTGYFEDHYAPSFVDRTKTLFENSFATVVVTPNRQARTLLIRAKGEYGADPQSSSGLEVLIHFVPMLGRYFQHMGDATTLVNNVGPFNFPDPIRADSHLENRGLKPIIFGNTVVVGGNVNNLNPRTRFDGHLSCRGH
ncbi:MAG: hypothetical protein IPN90_12240 [Elusimicrobia bacterium]|nr:hypothetical protein [Elusimicrobiota bacterium]